MTDDYTITFESSSERVAYLADFRKLPVRGQSYFSGFRYGDNGEKVRVFARQHVANPNTLTFSEKWEDRSL